MTKLAKYLIHRIQTEGPITIADYMAEALGHPQHGYYMTREPFGAAGDFITAPEVSQMFGELIGLWVADYWQRMGEPSKLALIELGPGRGTLMADALRALKAVAGLHDALSLHLVEMSPRLRALQQEKLKGGPRALWHQTLAEAVAASGGAPLIIIANEFFDALPIRQLVRRETGWHELMVEVGGDERFIPALSPAPSLASALLAPDVAAAPPGSLAEVCPAGLVLAGEIATAIKQQGGTALIIDYGSVTSLPGDSLQALTGHKFTDVFARPGEADITAHVDFASLARAAEGVTPWGPVGQGRFLKNLGLDARAQRLKRGATNAGAHNIDLAAKRLSHGDEMGDLFKVLCLTSPTGPIPAGFEE
jgi:NADH dehydrogenase [ubiquinone] 1 alpha subcomplex assembly factor 7